MSDNVCVVVVDWLPVNWIKHGTIIYVSLEYVKKIVEGDNNGGVLHCGGA